MKRNEVLKTTLLLLLILVCVNSPVFFLGRTLIPLAPAYGVLSPAPYGYRGPQAESPIALDPADSYNVVYAFDAYTVRALKQGVIPFWNPYQGLGQPFLANGVSAVLYPLNRLHLILPPAWWDMVYLLNWFLAAIFFVLYLGLLGFDWAIAAVGGVMILSSGFFQISLAQREIPAVIAWWPLLLYAVERTLQEPTWRHRHWVLALGVYGSITGGHPQVTFLSLFSVLIYAVVRLVLLKGPRLVSLVALLPGSLGGLLVSAPMWVNFAAYAFKAFSTHMEGAKVGLEHLGYQAIPTFFFPYIYGQIHEYPLGRIPGWEWLLTPGWLPALTGFLAWAALGKMLKNPGKGLILFTVLALITAAKIYGVPGINALGGLPWFERLNFPRYGAFLLTLAVAGMAVYGLRHLVQLESRRWLPYLIGWSVLVLGLFGLGIYSLWPNIRETGLESSAFLNLWPLGGLGLAWAILGPLALGWVKRRRPQDFNLFYLATAFGLLLQGVAYVPHGLPAESVVRLSLACLIIYVSVLSICARSDLIINPGKIMILGLMMVALSPMAASLLAPQGLPKRYNPVTRPPYISQLTHLQDQGAFRSYSFDSAPQPNFACPFGLSSLDNIEALAPLESNTFITTYLDRGTSAIWLAANLTAGRDYTYKPSAELLTNLRYYSLVGVRFMVGRQTEPLLSPFYDTELPPELSPIPIKLTDPLQVELICSEDVLSRVDVLIGTHRRRNPGMVKLKIWGDDGSLLASAGVSGRELKDNSFQKFVFPPISNLKGKKIRLELSFAPEAANAMISAWIHPHEPKGGLVFRLFSLASTPQTFPLVYEDPETEVRIWENPRAAPRLFLAPSAGVAQSWQEAQALLKDTPDLTRHVWLVEEPARESGWPADQPSGTLLAFRVEPNEVHAAFEAYTPGILTLTDSYSPGWRATLNGREVAVLLVDGAFRGLRIEKPGTYDIHFWYRPPHWNLSLVMAGLGILLVVGGCWVSWNRRQ